MRNLEKNKLREQVMDYQFKLNPWNYIAEISAQAYLKPSKKSKNNVTELFLPNTI
jgi:predicted transcriptional regulator with HTH domain